MARRSRRRHQHRVSDEAKRRGQRLLEDQGEILALLDVDDILVHPNIMGMVHRYTEGAGKFLEKDMKMVCVRENETAVARGECRPLVHHSVKARFDLVAEYRPPALRNVAFDFLDPEDGTGRIPASGLREHDDTRSRDERLSG